MTYEKFDLSGRSWVRLFCAPVSKVFGNPKLAEMVDICMLILLIGLSFVGINHGFRIA